MLQHILLPKHLLGFSTALECFFHSRVRSFQCLITCIILNIAAEYHIHEHLFMFSSTHVFNHFKRFASSQEKPDVLFDTIAGKTCPFPDGLFTYTFLSLIHISEPTRQAEISYAVFCL